MYNMQECICVGLPERERRLWEDECDDMGVNGDVKSYSKALRVERREMSFLEGNYTKLL